MKKLLMALVATSVCTTAASRTGAVATVSEEGRFIVATVEGKVLWQNK